MKLNSEFRHVMQPHRLRLHWGVFYTVLFFVIIGGLYFIANHINTHTLPVGKITISSPYSKYVVGEPVSFTLINGYNAPIYITNQCPSEPLAVYRQVGNSWVRLHANASSSCSGQQREVAVPASSQVTTSLAPWQSLFSQPGNYRLVAVVNGYSSLPYIDIQVIAPPAPNVVKNIIKKPAVRRQTQASSTQTTSSSNTEASENTTTNTTTSTTTTTAPKTYTLNVTSAGNYDKTSITMNVNDILKIVYSPPYSNEVITTFSPISPTTTVLSSITVDSEFHTRSKTMTVKGTWKYKAADHSGNSGIVTVN